MTREVQRLQAICARQCSGDDDDHNLSVTNARGEGATPPLESAPSSSSFVPSTEPPANSNTSSSSNKSSKLSSKNESKNNNTSASQGTDDADNDDDAGANEDGGTTVSEALKCASATNDVLSLVKHKMELALLTRN